MASFQGWVQLQLQGRLKDEALLVVLLAITTLNIAGCGVTNPASEPKIIGGETPATGSLVRRSTAAIYMDEFLLCSGVLVKADVVLSAAHCLIDVATPDQLSVAFELEDKAEKLPFAVKAMASHPKFASDIYDYDIAALTIDRTSEVDDGLAIIPIARPEEKIEHYLPITLAGFGTQSAETFIGGELRTLDTKVTSILNQDRPGLLVYGPHPNRSACFGDSGGPAFAMVDGQFKVIGTAVGPDEIVAGTSDCEDGAGLYTDLRGVNSFLEPLLRPTPKLR